MKKLRFLILIAFLTFTAAKLSAGTSDNADITGYSRDGKYAALQISGTEDGSGFYYITIRFLDVHNNRFVGPKISLRNEDEKPVKTVKDEADRKAAAYFKRYGIDKSIRPVAMNLSGSELRKTFSYNNKNHVINIDEIDTGEQCNSMAGMLQAKGFSISLNGRVLDKVDSPGECVFSYRIDSAMLYRGHVIIIYRELTPGFEGPDSRVLFSSATLR
ncbi:MAG TPA: DUF2259 domain-containing protein [Spirochaetota bacterium]|nr:DUF2259 domain-containing protein [Spirochaetota bacterium]